MPIQASGKETEEMEAEGDSAAEMSGEADESEEERRGSQTESEEESSEMDDEDYEQSRSECVSEVLGLEKQFSELKKLFREWLSELRLQLQEVGAERAPEYTEPLGGLQQSLKVRIQVVGIYKGFCRDVIRHKYECEQREPNDTSGVRSCCCMTRCLGSCRSGSRAWTSALSGGTTNYIAGAVRRPGTRCHPARGRRHHSFLAHTLCTCCRRSTSWKTGRSSKRPGQQCPLRREKQMDPDPAFILGGSLEQLVSHTGLTFLCKGRGLPTWPGLLCSLWDLYNRP